jgi:hypothetical protein
MKYLFSFSFFLLLSLFGFSQILEREVIGSAGGTESNNDSNIFISYDVGEAIIETYQEGVFTLTQGFEQPDTLYKPIEILEVSYKLYPNPGNGIIFLDLQGPLNVDLELKVYDVQSKLIQQHKVSLLANQMRKVELGLQSLASGVYLIEIFDKTGNKAYALRYLKT